jgi:hypothetical protein
MRGSSPRSMSGQQVSKWGRPPRILRHYGSDPRAGLIDWIGTQGGTGSFYNPQGTGQQYPEGTSGSLVWSQASAVLNAIYPTRLLTDESAATFCITQDAQNSWMWLAMSVFEFRPTEHYYRGIVGQFLMDRCREHHQPDADDERVERGCSDH